MTDYLFYFFEYTDIYIIINLCCKYFFVFCFLFAFSNPFEILLFYNLPSYISIKNRKNREYVLSPEAAT